MSLSFRGDVTCFSLVPAKPSTGHHEVYREGPRTHWVDNGLSTHCQGLGHMTAAGRGHSGLELRGRHWDAGRAASPKENDSATLSRAGDPPPGRSPGCGVFLQGWGLGMGQTASQGPRLQGVGRGEPGGRAQSGKGWWHEWQRADLREKHGKTMKPKDDPRALRSSGPSSEVLPAL